MNKENVLFSIIGVLLGFIVGFIFAVSVNNRAAATTPVSGAAAASGELPADHPQLPVNAVKDQQALLSAADEAARQAKADPNNFEAQRKAADFYHQLERYDEALEYLLRANQAKPDDYETVVALGNLNYDVGRYEVAERWYTAALVKNPNDVNVRTDLGLTFFLRPQPNLDRALAEFRRSLQTDPNHEQTLQNLIVVLTQKGELKEAESSLEKLQKLNPNNQGLPTLRSRLEEARNKGGAPAQAKSGDAKK